MNIKDILLPTLNKMGYSAQIIDEEYSGAYINYLKHLSNPYVLEIGAGYGTAVAQALSAGAHVTANDLEKRHLDILKKSIPEDKQLSLKLILGKFPEDLVFSSKSFDAILMSQVIHFLRAEEIEKGLILLYDWLKPQGKLFVTAISPYMGVLKDFLPTYELRKKQRMFWPGQIENSKIYFNHSGDNINPDFVHVFDPDVLKFHFTKAGFNVEKVDDFSTRHGDQTAFKNNGRECVGIIVSKP